MSPPYVDEDPNAEMVEKGLRVAENERRDLMTEEYEDEAVRSEDSEEALDDIEYPEGGAHDEAPEISAMKEIYPTKS